MMEEPESRVGKTEHGLKRTNAVHVYCERRKCIPNKEFMKRCALSLNWDLLVISRTTWVVTVNTKDAELTQFRFIAIGLVSFTNLFSLSISRSKMAYCSQMGKQL